MSRGGSRNGAPGKAYQNRSDLNGAPKQLPLQSTSNVYGEGAALRQAQQQVPMAGAQQAPGPPQPPGPPGPPQGQPSPQGQPDLSSILGGLKPLGTPTAPPGPGFLGQLRQGLQAQQSFQPDPMVAARAMLNTIPTTHMTPQLQALKNALGASVTNANNPGLGGAQ